MSVCLCACSCQCHKEKMKQPMRKTERLVPHHALVSLSNLWQSAQSQGFKDRRCWGKRKPRLRKRSILCCETRSVGYLLSIDLMMLEKHLTQLLNWGYKSSVELLFFLSFSFLFIFTPRSRKKLKTSTTYKNTWFGPRKVNNRLWISKGTWTHNPS